MADSKAELWESWIDETLLDDIRTPDRPDPVPFLTTTDGDLDAFPSDEGDSDDDGPRVTGPHIGFDKYGNADHRYWRCENCGVESAEKRALGNCC